jgi:hypothetical protein
LEDLYPVSTTPQDTGPSSHVHHLLPAVLTGSLSLAERERVTTHVRECAECSADLAEWMVVGAAVERTTASVAAPPRLARNLLDRLLPAPAGRAGRAQRVAAGFPLFGKVMRLPEAGRLGSIMAASLGATALIASNSGLAQQVLLRSHITSNYYVKNGYEYHGYGGTLGYGFPLGAFNTPSPVEPAPGPGSSSSSSGVPGTSSAPGLQNQTGQPGNSANAPGNAGTGTAPGLQQQQSQPLTGTTTTFTLPGNRTVTVTISQEALAGLPASLRNSLSVQFNSAPNNLNEVQQGSLGGGNVTPAGSPFDIKFTAKDPVTGAPIALPAELLNIVVEVKLPVTVNLSTLPQNAEFEVLQEVRVESSCGITGTTNPAMQIALAPAPLASPITGGFMRNVSKYNEFDNSKSYLSRLDDLLDFESRPISFESRFLSSCLVGTTGSTLSTEPGGQFLRQEMTIGALQGTLFLPAVLTPAWVQNHNANIHVFSGPFANDVDFGLAGPQFTTFTVVAPQIGTRLFVFNAATLNYGWIDVAGVGPSGPPRP